MVALGTVNKFTLAANDKIKLILRMGLLRINSLGCPNLNSQRALWKQFDECGGRCLRKLGHDAIESQNSRRLIHQSLPAVVFIDRLVTSENREGMILSLYMRAMPNRLEQQEHDGAIKRF